MGATAYRHSPVRRELNGPEPSVTDVAGGGDAPGVARLSKGPGAYLQQRLGRSRARPHLPPAARFPVARSPRETQVTTARRSPRASRRRRRGADPHLPPTQDSLPAPLAPSLLGGGPTVPRLHRDRRRCRRACQRPLPVAWRPLQRSPSAAARRDRPSAACHQALAPPLRGVRSGYRGRPDSVHRRSP